MKTTVCKNRKHILKDINKKISLSKKQFKDALNEVSEWEHKLSDIESKAFTYHECRRLIVNRVFDKYCK